MNSEKVKEIKEKLQEEIFMANSFGDKIRKVPTRELEKILTLINELESENENIKTQKSAWKKQFERLLNENQQLKDQIAELEARLKELQERK